MSFLPFLGITLAAAAGSLLVHRWARASLGIGLAGLALGLVAAIAIRPDETLAFGGGSLLTSEYARLVAILGTGTSLLLSLVGLAAAWQRMRPAASLAGIAGVTLALSIPDPLPAVVASIAAGLAGVLVSLGAPGDGRAAKVGVRLLRSVVLGGALALVAVAWASGIGGPLGSDTTGAPLVAAYLAVALAVALRFGVIPFHAWAGRLTEAAPSIGLPLLLAWSPAALGIVVLGWIDGSIAPLLLPLEAERGLVIAVGAATILLGAFAAWIQDDLDHLVGYSIAQDAGFVILALAALDPASWEPARTWVLVFALVKTAFAAWATAMRATFGTRRIDDLAGWARANPPLAIGLLAIAVATIGWPGSAAAAARGDLVRLALTDPLGIVVTLGGLASLLYYGRLLAVGVAAPGAHARQAPRWRPIRLAEATSAGSRPGTPSGVAEASAADSRLPESLAHLRLGLAATATRGIVAWTANATAISGGLVVVLAAISLLAAAGALGIPDAARSGAPGLD